MSRAGHEARVDVARLALGEEAFAATCASGRPAGVQHAPGHDLAAPARSHASARRWAIAKALFIGPRTVNTYVGHILAKFSVRKRAAALTAAVAVAAEMLDPDSFGQVSSEAEWVRRCAPEISIQR